MNARRGFTDPRGEVASVVHANHGHSGEDVRRSCRRGFSLIELVIVIVIMGTVAAIAIPRMSHAAQSAAAANLRASLKTLNTATEMYALEHEGLNPAQAPSGAVDPLVKNLVHRLTRTTSVSGELLALRRPFGPYLRAIPANPINGLSSVRIDGSASRAGTHGWRFDSSTNSFMPDHKVTGVAVQVDAQAQVDVQAGNVSAQSPN